MIQFEKWSCWRLLHAICSWRCFRWRRRLPSGRSVPMRPRECWNFGTLPSYSSPRMVEEACGIWRRTSTYSDKDWPAFRNCFLQTVIEAEGCKTERKGSNFCLFKFSTLSLLAPLWCLRAKTILGLGKQSFDLLLCYPNFLWPMEVMTLGPFMQTWSVVSLWVQARQLGVFQQPSLMHGILFTGFFTCDGHIFSDVTHGARHSEGGWVWRDGALLRCGLTIWLIFSDGLKSPTNWTFPWQTSPFSPNVFGSFPRFFFGGDLFAGETPRANSKKKLVRYELSSSSTQSIIAVFRLQSCSPARHRPVKNFLYMEASFQGVSRWWIF